MRIEKLFELNLPAAPRRLQAYSNMHTETKTWRQSHFNSCLSIPLLW
jgi:hypothetical protein